MKKTYIILALCFLIPIRGIQAQEKDMFGIGEDILGDIPADIPQSTSGKDTLSEFLMHKLPLASARNINKAEKVYCYTVEYAPKDYDGYLIDDLAVKGSCGELSDDGKKLIKDSLFKNSIIYSNSVANCQITPKIMLRYVYGLDYTDVLLSYPCPSLTFFHGRDTTILNAAPGGTLIEKLVSAYGKLEEKFYSPALLGQMVANGQPQTQAQKEMVRLNAPTDAPRKKWNADATDENQSPQQPAKSGWNKLK